MRRPLALAVAAGLLLVACARPASDAAGGDAEGQRLLPEDRLELPEFDMARFEALLEELRGTPVVVNVWGSWCPPCAVEAPELAEVSREFEGRVQFLGVDILDDRRSARDFILRYDWPYPSVFDPDAEIRDGLGYVGQPVTVIYDRDGEVAFEWAGAVTGEQLREELAKIV